MLVERPLEFGWAAKKKNYCRFNSKNGRFKNKMGENRRNHINPARTVRARVAGEISVPIPPQMINYILPYEEII